MNGPEAVREVEAVLDGAGVPDARVDAELLVAHVLGVPRSQAAVPNGPLDAAAEAELRALAERRAAREPLQYVLGEWGFRRLVLRVDSRALVPRPETEVLVDRCVALLDGVAEPRALDVGTGTGAIALSLLDELPTARVVATDASADALTLAGENAGRLGLAERFELRHGDLLEPARGETFDLVAANPPYVGPALLETLAPEIAEWEPHEAIFDRGQTDALVDAAGEVLRPGGALVVEVSEGTAPRIAARLAELGYGDVAVTRDYAGVERVVEGRLP